MTMTSDNHICLLKTAYIVYYHEDLDATRQFFLDFCMTVALE